MSYPAIEAKGVRFSYGKNEILHGMDFAAQKGQLIAVLGYDADTAKAIQRFKTACRIL